MTRAEAITIWRRTGLAFTEGCAPKDWFPDQVEEMLMKCAASDVDGFIALGILNVEDAASAALGE